MKELLFSVTAKDCRFDYFKGTGKGGQKRNKTESGVRCTHLDSEAVGRSDDTRSQHKNKAIAFGRMAEDERFKRWHKIETAKATGEQIEIEEKVERGMRNLKIEGIVDGKWELLA